MSKKKSEKQNRPWYRKWWGILLLIACGLPIAIITLTTVAAVIYGISDAVNKPSVPSSRTQDKQQPPQQPSIYYIDPTKDITSTQTVGTRYIIVTGYLFNNTGKEGVADCNVEFYDHELNWAGGKGIGGRTLKPGERYNFTLQVEVEHTGLVAKQGINCE